MVDHLQRLTDVQRVVQAAQRGDERTYLRDGETAAQDRQAQLGGDEGEGWSVWIIVWIIVWMIVLVIVLVIKWIIVLVIKWMVIVLLVVI